jgi:hypothetical protein
MEGNNPALIMNKIKWSEFRERKYIVQKNCPYVRKLNFQVTPPTSLTMDVLQTIPKNACELSWFALILW